MLFWLFSAFCAFFVKGVCGFANTLVFTSMLSFGSTNIGITPVDLLLGYPPNLIMMLRGRKTLQWKVILPLIALILAGDAAGALLLKNVDVGKVKILFGLAVIAVALEMLTRQYRPKRKGSPIVLAFIGILSGVMSGLFGVAALMVAYVSRMTESSEAMKANLGAVFAADNTFRLILYLAMGIVTVSSLKTALTLLPAALLGLFLGVQCGGKLKEAHVRMLVILLLLASGAVLIAKNL
ncbi:MAG: sulfite exporter TauE/SafE family protein [Clostridia bacterium]|nr:sulfite exporter TauE/SafE family protein [Clostridia bacterium]